MTSPQSINKVVSVDVYSLGLTSSSDYNHREKIEERRFYADTMIDRTKEEDGNNNVSRVTDNRWRHHHHPHHPHHPHHHPSIRSSIDDDDVANIVRTDSRRSAHDVIRDVDRDVGRDVTRIFLHDDLRYRRTNDSLFEEDERRQHSRCHDDDDDDVTDDDVVCRGELPRKLTRNDVIDTIADAIERAGSAADKDRQIRDIIAYLEAVRRDLVHRYPGPRTQVD